MIEPAIHGTQFVITAAADAGVKRVVFTSSIGTVYMNPYRDPNKPVDDTCWSDLDYCKKTEVCILLTLPNDVVVALEVLGGCWV